MTESRFNDQGTAQAYEGLLLKLIFEPWGRLLLAKAGLKHGDRVLDVATGPGTLARMAGVAVGPLGRVTGVDNSVSMLAQAKAKAPLPKSAPLDYVEASVQALPFEDGSFDAVLCQQGLQFFPDQAGALKEMKRVLKPGGHLTLAMWKDAKAMTLFAAFHDALEAVLADAPKRAALGWLELAQLRGLLEQAGFKDAAVTEETMNVVLEGGLPQAMECVAGTTASAAVRGMNADQKAKYVTAVAERLAPYLKGHAIHAPAGVLMAVATA